MTIESTAITGPHPAHGLLGRAARHLVHCPPSWDHYLLEAPSSGEERFLLTGDTPGAHPLFNDGPGHFHDPQLVTEAVREVGEFVGHQYFGVPSARPGLFYRVGLELTETAAWRRGSGPARMTTELRAVPGHVVDGVPRDLDFRLEVSLDDTPCATGTASLVFVMPGVHRRQLAHSRWAVRAAPELADEPDGPVRPVAPGAVGRGAAANVVLGEPVGFAGGRLSLWLLAPSDNPALGGSTPDGHLSGTLLMEALRQAAVLTAGRTVGLVPERTLPASCRVHFRGFAEADLPVRCTAEPGPLGRDGAGRPAVPVTLTLTQNRRTVVEARTTVVQDF
ncbi:AfsA-related hotdog domain-containing protein [Kitasatospora sp. NPDC057198]|uniref:AfsA-related hotdog domain-containing protein n=1 Tax=Kitasatospora sp. NPDC057198 TaxID=3346046 RepID=UPI0036319E6B